MYGVFIDVKPQGNRSLQTFCRNNTGRMVFLGILLVGALEVPFFKRVFLDMITK